MKDRDEFLASVYAKRDQELVRRKKYKKRMAAGLSAAAACLVLMVGLSGFDVVDFMDMAGGGMGADGAAMESMVENEAAEDGHRDTVAPGAAPNAAPGLESDTARKDIYDLTADGSSDDLAYYCLPCFSIEEFGEGSASMTRGSSMEDVAKVQAWVDRLAENGQLLEGEPESLDDVTCIVTIELEPQQKEVYYLTGEVGWYE